MVATHTALRASRAKHVTDAATVSMPQSTNADRKSPFIGVEENHSRVRESPLEMNM